MAPRRVSRPLKADLVKGLGGIVEDATPDEPAMLLAAIPAVPNLLHHIADRA